MKPRFLAAALIAVLLTISLSSSAFARTRTVLYDSGPKKGQSTGITLITPDTHSNYVDAQTSDKIISTGVGNRVLRGRVKVEFVVDGGRQLIPNGVYPISQTGDLDLTVYYPPVSTWPPQSNGTREIHVDISIELFEGGVKVATLGPGNDWDVFNRYQPPPRATCLTGCKASYWLNRTDKFPTIYSADKKFNAVFGVGPDITLSAALASTGNGQNGLVREATAALLNASNTSVAYGMPAEAVRLLTVQAFSSGSYDVVKDIFAAQNGLNCPLQ